MSRFPALTRCRAGAERFADVSAVLPVTTAAGAGYLVLSLAHETAAALARRVLAEAGVEPDAAVVRDCVGRCST